MPRPVTRQEMYDWFCSPRCGKGEPRVGAEYETLIVDRRTKRQADYEGERGVEALLRAIRDRNVGGDWKAVHEDGHLIELDRDGATITLEPGNQLELSTAPRATVLELEKDFRRFVAELEPVARSMDLAVLAIGVNPFSRADEVTLGPKKRYRLMTDYLSKTGKYALDMMRRTTSVHCSFDYVNEADAVEKTRIAFGAAPIITAMFAHSPVEKVRASGFRSFRAEIWRHTDPARCGSLPEVFREGWDFHRYLDRVLELPLIFTRADGVYRAAHGMPAAKWFAGDWDGLEGHEGLEPKAADLEWVINQSFRDARLRRYLECRAADFPSPAMASTSIAAWTGLLYDPGARRDAWEALRGLTDAERETLAAEVPAKGLQARAGKRTALDLARDLAKIARKGLVARKAGEETLLDPLDALLAEGLSPADDLLRKWTPGDADALIELLSLR